jgi:hypothetical protein
MTSPAGQPGLGHFKEIIVAHCVVFTASMVDIWYLLDVETSVWVRVNTIVHKCRQYCAGDHGFQPIFLHALP